MLTAFFMITKVGPLPESKFPNIDPCFSLPSFSFLPSPFFSLFLSISVPTSFPFSTFPTYFPLRVEMLVSKCPKHVHLFWLFHGRWELVTHSLTGSIYWWGRDDNVINYSDVRIVALETLRGQKNNNKWLCAAPNTILSYKKCPHHRQRVILPCQESATWNY